MPGQVMIVLLSLLIFLGSAALDFASARYQQSLACQQAHMAGVWSVAMACIASVAYVSVVKVSYYLIIPECLGLYAGTMLAVNYRKYST